MKLFFMRHGEAEDYAQTDAERTLTKRGKENSQRIAKAIVARVSCPNIILASPYRRAQQTAEIVQAAFSNAVTIETCDLITPDDDPMKAIRYIGSREEQSIIVVTHNPIVTSMVNLLCSTGSGFHMGTSSVAEVQADIPDIGCGELLWQQHI